MTDLQRDQYMQSFVEAYHKGNLKSLDLTWNSDCSNCTTCPASPTCKALSKNGYDNFRTAYANMIQHYPEYLV